LRGRAAARAAVGGDRGTAKNLEFQHRETPRGKGKRRLRSM
jgi:hypothetical protein